MLQTLFIQDYALIRKLNISFDEGFSVITGETGAGKSIILGGLGLLLGQRADTKAIRNGATKCVIEAHFVLKEHLLEPFFQEHELDYDDECIMRREVYSSGKSRAFINDTPVQLALMKELGEKLIDIHSQHQNLLLNREDFQLEVLDIVAGNMPLLSHYLTVYKQWRKNQRELQQLIEQMEKDKADEDYLQFQWRQLDEARLRAGEQEELEQESEMLTHAEDIKSGLYRAGECLIADENGILTALKDCRNAIQGILKVYSGAEELYNRLDSSYIELEDIGQELEKLQESIEFNPSRLDEVNERLNLIYTLQQKHHVKSVEELLSLEEEFVSRLKVIDHSDEQIGALQKVCDELRQKLVAEAADLTARRKEAAKELEQRMVEMLLPLGMPNVQFKIAFEARNELSESGIDSVCFMFCANKNGRLQPIAEVASGGEVARVMLSVKALVSGAEHLPTIIFDEIDTGVSGNIADKMAQIMQGMGAEGRQVISITHLPQIAARGKAHYKVYKQDNDTETISNISLLTAEERVEEIAHMLSGASLTSEALDNARVLLQGNNNN